MGVTTTTPPPSSSKSRQEQHQPTAAAAAASSRSCPGSSWMPRRKQLSTCSTKARKRCRNCSHPCSAVRQAASSRVQQQPLPLKPRAAVLLTGWQSRRGGMLRRQGLRCCRQGLARMQRRQQQRQMQRPQRVPLHATRCQQQQMSSLGRHRQVRERSQQHHMQGGCERGH